MDTQFQLDLDNKVMHLPGWQKFEDWKLTRGGNKVLQYCFKFAAYYAERFRKHGRTASFSLVWEQVRDRIEQVKKDARRRGIDVKSYRGYQLNNDFRSYVARYLMERRPEWKGAFRLREQGTNKVEQRERV